MLGKVKNLKDMGNTMYSKRDFFSAIFYYKEAMKQCRKQNLHILFSNLAAAYTALEKFKEAHEYSLKCIQANPTFEKGHVRAVRACIGLENFHKAKEHLSHVGDLKMRSTLQTIIEELTCPIPYKMKLIENLISPKLPKTSDEDRKKLLTVFCLDTFYTFIYSKRIFMFGGRITDCMYLNSLFEFDAKRKSWKFVKTHNDKEKPPPVHGHRLFFDETELVLYVYGGVGMNSSSSTSYLWRLEMSTMSWKEKILFGVKRKGRGRGFSAFGRIDNVIYVVGGMILEGQAGSDQGEKILKYFVKERRWECCEVKLLANDNNKEKERKDLALRTMLWLIPKNSYIFCKERENSDEEHICYLIPQHLHSIYKMNLKRCTVEIFQSKMCGLSNEKLNYDSPLLIDYYKNPEKMVPWDGTDRFNVGIYFIVEGTIHFLRRGRYLQRLKIEEDHRKKTKTLFEWENVAYLSNTKVVDQLISKKLKAYSARFSVSGTTVGGRKFSSRAAPKWKIEHDRLGIIKRDVFHTVQVLDGKAFCFSSSSWDSTSNSMVQFAMEKKDHWKTRQRLLWFWKDHLNSPKAFFDVVVHCLQ